MAVYQIDGKTFIRVFHYGVSLLEANKQAINQLNVFPVPDGDTGTNMSLTARSAMNNTAQAAGERACDVAEAISKGALKGARGNSGVIFSQLFRGFALGMAGCETIDTKVMAAAMQKGVETAYKAVMKPREGTILTVARAAAEAAAAAAQKETDLVALMQYVLKMGNEALDRTPDQLEVLKKAGVVDAGGKGLMVIYEGFLAAMEGKMVEEIDAMVPEAPAPAPVQNTNRAFTAEEHIEFGYCTEFIIEKLARGVDEDRALEFRSTISEFGDCAVVVYDSDMIKVHVHSNAPDRVLSLALQLGELDSIKIENMRVQHREMLGLQEEIEAAQTQSEPQQLEHKAAAMVTVASGEGLKKIFADLFVEGFVEGGQTMNPSAEDIARAVRYVNADTVYVLPNNSNIILAARQAEELVDCNLVVIPSKTMPQGVAAALCFDPEAPADEVAAAMTEALTTVASGQVTYAVRDSEMNGHTIQQGDIMGLNDDGIACVGREIGQTTLELVRLMAQGGNADMITLYSGAEVDEAQREEMVALVQEAFPQSEVAGYEGGQPVYYYLVSVE